MLAIIKTGGKQYKVKVGAKIRVEKLEAAEGEEVKFSSVLLMAQEDGTRLQLGRPEIADAAVAGKILQQARAKKIDVIKYKQKSRYFKKYGHRQPYFEIKIDSIK